MHLRHVVEKPLAAGVWSSEIHTAEIAGLQIKRIRDATERLRGVVPRAPDVTAQTRRNGGVFPSTIRERLTGLADHLGCQCK